MIKLNLSGHENAHLSEMGFVFPGTLHVSLEDPELPEKLVKFLVGLGVTSESKITVALPGLSPLAALVLVTIHGLTGNFPAVQLLIRSTDGTFVPGMVIDMNEVRNYARANRPGAIVL